MPIGKKKIEEWQRGSETEQDLVGVLSRESFLSPVSCLEGRDSSLHDLLWFLKRDSNSHLLGRKTMQRWEEQPRNHLRQDLRNQRNSSRVGDRDFPGGPVVKNSRVRPLIGELRSHVSWRRPCAPNPEAWAPQLESICLNKIPHVMQLRPNAAK